jgi:pyruvate kinase
MLQDLDCAPRTTAPSELERALHPLEEVRADMLERERRLEPLVADLPAAARPSARNLIHYLALRLRDMEPVQRVLAGHGLSSLGRAEPHVLANLQAVLRVLRCVVGGPSPDGEEPAPPVGFEEGEKLRRERTAALFGRAPPNRSVRIMATLPPEAASTYALVRGLVAGGMDCARINCAHDGPEAWERMIRNVRRAGQELDRPCAVLMDVSGPRLRTGAMEPGPRVVKVRPARDDLGRVVRPARVWLTPAEAPAPAPAPADATLPLPAAFLAGLAVGAILRFRDARHARRRMRVAARAGSGVWCELDDTAYVVTGTRMRVRPPDSAARTAAEVGELPPRKRKIPLAAGDTLTLTRAPTPGRAAVLDDGGALVEPARIPCDPPEALGDLHLGERVWFDEGRIGGVVSAVDADAVQVQITSTRPGGERLGEGKGINLPDTELRLPSLTPADVAILPFIHEHADLVGYSFARSAADVRHLRAELARLGPERLGVVLKVETPAAFRELPRMLLEAMRFPAAGVMIARGDLAVECGFERLAELQEEILCMCEAAHVPVVWATQVLEQLTVHGTPSRAEVSDVVLGDRAEAVMLNKGRYLPEAVRMLDDILARMHRHQEKKRPLLSHLGVADHFFAAVDAPAAG